MTDYATLEEIKAYLKIDDADTQDDELIEAALTSVSREIESVCGRVFTTASVASARTYEVCVPGLLKVDDFHTTDGLLIDGVAYSSSTWTLHPRNGVVGGQTGWPYNRITPGASWSLTLCAGDEVEVTAKWGWAAVPAPIHEACKIATSDTFGMKDARFGVDGFNEFGPFRVRDNHAVMAKLSPYIRTPILVY